MLNRYSKDESKGFEVENYVDWFFLIFEYFGTLINELIDFEDAIFLLIHILDEPFDESA